MTLSISNLKPVFFGSELINLTKCEKKVATEQTHMLLQQKKEGQLNVKDMAGLINKTNTISPKTRRKAQNIIVMMNEALKNGVKDSNDAIFQVIKDIACKKINLDELEKSKDGMNFKITGADGKTYDVRAFLDGNDVIFRASQAAIQGDKKNIEINYESSLTSFNINTLKALPEVYAENK